MLIFKTAYWERKTITRGTKETSGKEKIRRPGKSKNQSTGYDNSF